MTDTRDNYLTYDKCKTLIKEQISIHSNEDVLNKHTVFVQFACNRLQRAIELDPHYTRFSIHIPEDGNTYSKALTIDDDSELPPNEITYYSDAEDYDEILYRDDLLQIFTYLGYTVSSETGAYEVEDPTQYYIDEDGNKTDEPQYDAEGEMQLWDDPPETITKRVCTLILDLTA